MRVTLISGRDRRKALEQLRAVKAAADGPVEVLIHPWTQDHPSEGAMAFQRMLAVNTERHLVILTFQDWLFNLLGELIAVKPHLIRADQAEVFLCEGGEARRFVYGNDGFFTGGWPIGYFVYDDVL